MNEQERLEETQTCHQEIQKIEELRTHHRMLYEQMRHKYERPYPDIKVKLKAVIEKETRQRSFLISKLIVLKDHSLCLKNIKAEELDVFIKYFQEAATNSKFVDNRLFLSGKKA